ncbi:helix-turn-helix transcriptional regulator [Dysgonomonas capnocytophagoides]|uniref:helix-turn-helix transcriptional regulator n=1 Tax=Dysgonomonas capnocytophagoides TaxID=45254 RepID=UPI0033419B61
MDDINKIKQEPVKERTEIIDNSPDYKNIRGNISQTIINGISIDRANLLQKDTFSIPVDKDEEHIEIYFELIGHKQYRTNNSKYNIEIHEGRYSFFYIPHIDGILSFKPQNNYKKSIGIELSRDFLLRLLNGDLKILGAFGEKILNKEPGYFAQNTTISQPMMAILKDVMECQLTGILKKIFIESKVIELILLVIQQGENVSQNYLSPFLTKDDIDKIYHVREIVSQKIDNPYSIRELSRISGLNEFKLKKGFREVFDTTIFKYLMEERMHYSKQLIIESDKNISEVSATVGYKNPTHFTVAFKRYYGYLPSDLKNGQNLF